MKLVDKETGEIHERKLLDSGDWSFYRGYERTLPFIVNEMNTILYCLREGIIGYHSGLED